MRKAEIVRDTKETKIELALNLDGKGKYEVDTGVGFFDHMMTLFACHSGFDFSVKCAGDTRVDGHHSVEDIG
ncbi:MAG: imidazoleglycerol-phosphate dehydratase, partial [Clostridia bacterium]|nr:imidazoleglycerol-phosphate dehydratase [Clostridia bacterium]